MGQFPSSTRIHASGVSDVVVVESRAADISDQLDKIYAPWKSASRRADDDVAASSRPSANPEPRPTGQGTATAYLDGALRDMYEDDHSSKRFRHAAPSVPEQTFRSAVF
eukprot:jgi/Mesvir1/11360/Mv10260-RA.1